MIQQVRKRQMEEAAVAWALDEVEAQLREEPAHRLTGEEDVHSWLLTAANGIGVHVEATRVEGPKATTVEFDLSAAATGLLPGHAKTERKLLLPLDGQAAREPELLYLVFETGGRVYAFEGLEDAGNSLEGTDVQDYLGAFSDQGEVIDMKSGDLSWIEFTPTGTFDRAALQVLIQTAGRFSQFASDPHRLALAVWYAA